MNEYHVSVLLKEVTDLLDVREGKKYIDATLGGGGHSCAISERGGRVLSLDVDQEAIDFVRGKIKDDKKIILAKGNFRDIEKLARENGFDKVDGILFDLGVSSHQLEKAERGFSFRKSGPLDMRMDNELNVRARDLINILTKGELYDLFNKLGEERFAFAITNSIIRSRRVKPIETTSDLTEIVNQVVRNPGTRSDVLARIYQALRIAVNDELNSLRIALPGALNIVGAGGVIAVISFHSLEDRIVKNQFLEWAEEGRGKILTRKPVVPGEEEIAVNFRSRSAKLRAFIKTKI